MSMPNRYNDLTAWQKKRIDALINAIAAGTWDERTEVCHSRTIDQAIEKVDEDTIKHMEITKAERYIKAYIAAAEKKN